MTSFQARDLLSFDKMIFPTLVRIVYYLGLLGIALATLVAVFGALGVMRFSASGGLGTLVATVAIAGLGTLVWRVTCEFWVLVHGIYERLGEIRDRGKMS